MFWPSWFKSDKLDLFNQFEGSDPSTGIACFEPLGVLGMLIEEKDATGIGP